MGRPAGRIQVFVDVWHILSFFVAQKRRSFPGRSRFSRRANPGIEELRQPARQGLGAVKGRGSPFSFSAEICSGFTNCGKRTPSKVLSAKGKHLGFSLENWNGLHRSGFFQAHINFERTELRIEGNSDAGDAFP